MIFLILFIWSFNIYAAPDGQALYHHYCSVCHQSEGKGGIGLPLTEDILAQVSDDYLLKTIRQGRPGRIMPAFQQLSQAQVKAIIRYIRSWYQTPGQIFDPQPLSGHAEKGRILYQTHCQQCHGSKGNGEGLGTGVTLSRKRNFMIMPPALNNPGFQAAASDRMIQLIIQNGRPDKGMPRFQSILSPEQIADIVRYIRRLSPQPVEQGSEEWAGQAAYIVESPYDLTTTVQNLKQALQGANFRLFPDRYFDQGLADEFSVDKKRIAIRFCNFNELYHLLNIEPRLGILLPCRITVIETPQGVILVAPNFVELARLFNNQELYSIALLMEDIILAVMEEATL